MRGPPTSGKTNQLNNHSRHSDTFRSLTTSTDLHSNEGVEVGTKEMDGISGNVLESEISETDYENMS